MFRLPALIEAFARRAHCNSRAHERRDYVGCAARYTFGRSITCVTLALALAVLPWLPSPAHANDSEAEIGIGGLVLLKQSDAIVMEAEDLYISEKLVRVRYRYRNVTDKPVSTTVAFPTPAQPRGFSDRWYDLETPNDFSDFGFATRIDGQPVQRRRIDRAMIGQRDVTERLRELGWPLYWMNENGSSDLVEAMDEKQRKQFAAEGLITEEEMFDYRPMPAWDLVTYFVREQVFPANATVTVEHEYVPMVGGSVGGALYAATRKDSPEILEVYRDEYCVDDYFLAGFDRRMAGAPKGKMRTYMETWIAYVLSSGANWSGPIRDFRLVIDKGSPDNLVSFCMAGVDKISPTQFEVRKRDYTPERDLRVLIANFEDYDE